MDSREELVDALEKIADDIDGFLADEWDGNPEGWKALSVKARAAIDNARRRTQ